MNRKLISLLLVLMLGVAAFAGCTSAPTASVAAGALTWDGATMTGAPFNKRTMSVITVHYAKPTMPSKAERIGHLVQQFLDEHQSWGRLMPGDRLDLWIIPDGYSWPQELPPLDRRERFARAVKPRTVVLEERLIPADPQDKYSVKDLGVFAAVAVAVTQQETSPAYSIGWLHDGMGGVFTEEWRFFPAGQFTRDFAGTVTLLSSPRTPPEILYVLNDANPLTPLHMKPLDAATGLAALVMDRWGIDWLEHYPKTPEELTPEAAMMWATGAKNPGAAAAAATARMQRMQRNYFFEAGELNYRKGASLADTGLNRLTPRLEQLPPVESNESRQAYRIAADWDPATRTLSGEEVLTWTNGEGVPIRHLYFNVWGNATPMLWFGGSSTVEAVAVDGRPAAFTFRGIDLEVDLGRSVGPGQTAEVSIRFATRLSAPVPPPPHIGVVDTTLVGTNPETEAVWSLNLWYPTLAILDAEGWNMDPMPDAGVPRAEFADYDVSIMVPPGSRVMSSYIDVTETPVGNGTLHHSRARYQAGWRGRMVVDK